MRSDVKVGLICGLVVAAGGIAYFAWPTHQTKTSGLTNNVPPIVQESSANGSSGPMIAGPTDTMEHVPVLGPSPALAATPAPATAPSAPYPAGFSAPVIPTATPIATTAGTSGSGTSGNTLVLEPPSSGTPGTPGGLSTTPPGTLISGRSSLTPPSTTTPPSYSPPAYGAGAGTPATPPGPTLQLESASSGSSGGGTYVVKSGDSFAKIAKASFGNAKFATIKAIEQANPGVDSRHLKIGQKLNLPTLPTTAAGASTPETPATPATPAEPTPAAAGATTRTASSHTHKHTTASSSTSAPSHALAGGTYTIKAGDNLHKIARAVYGDDRRWKQIARTNRDILTDSDDLEVGMVIKLPPQ